MSEEIQDKLNEILKDFKEVKTKMIPVHDSVKQKEHQLMLSKQKKIADAQDPELSEQQYRKAYLQMKCNAVYYGTPFKLSLEEYIKAWGDKWVLRGKTSNEYMMVRLDPNAAITPNNITPMTVTEMRKRSKFYKKAKKIRQQNVEDDGNPCPNVMEDPISFDDNSINLYDNDDDDRDNE